MGCVVLEPSLDVARGLCTSPGAPTSTLALASTAGITRAGGSSADPRLPVTGIRGRRAPRRFHVAQQLKLSPSQNQHEPNLCNNFRDAFPGGEPVSAWLTRGR